VVALSLSGCQKATEPKGGPLNAGPYPECRSITEWLRLHTHDPELTVASWGPRTEEPLTKPSEASTAVLIEVHYQTTIGKKRNGNWKQTLRVIGRNIMEETEPVAE
jgi:hypothetical protein